MAAHSEIVQLERSFKTLRELLVGRPRQLEPAEYTWTDVDLLHLVGGLVRRFGESFEPGQDRTAIASYRPYFLGDVGTHATDPGTRQVEEGTNRLLSVMMILIQLHRLQKVSGIKDPVPSRELIEPERFGSRRAALDGRAGASFVRDLFEGQARPVGIGEHVAHIWPAYEELGWLLEGALGPSELPVFAEWLLERVFVVEISVADEEFSAEITRSLREDPESLLLEASNGGIVEGLRLRPSVERGQKAIQSLFAAAAEGGEDATRDRVGAPAEDALEAARDVISYLVGAAFGQWDVRIPVADSLLRTGYEDQPPEVLVDDPGHRLDIENRVYAAAKVVLDEDASEVLVEAAAELGYESVRAYLRAGFFQDHLRRYSRSRRQAPIYWPLGVPSGRWSTWLFAPRLSSEMLAEVERLAQTRLQPPTELRALRDDGGGARRGLHLHSGVGGNGARKDSFSAKGAERDDETLAAELLVFIAEAQRIGASGWKPDLEDGAVLCAAPLADLCPSWPELQGYRREIRSGGYPWASVSRFANVI